MSDNMKNTTFNCPNHFYKRLREIAHKRQIPISRLIAIAVDNELHREDARFKQDLELPNLDDYDEFEFAHEGGKILEFLNNVPYGTGLDVMMLLRYEIGIPDKARFLGGFTELLERDFLIESYATPNKYRRDVPADYKIYQTREGKNLLKMKAKSRRFKGDK